MTSHQFKAPRFETHVAALAAALEYAKLTPHVVGLHVEPLHEGGDRKVVGYTVRVADEDGYTIGYAGHDAVDAKAVQS